MNQLKIRRNIILLSPFIILVIGNFSARLFIKLLGKWAWTGYFMIYWGMILLILVFSGSFREKYRSWFRKSQGSPWWKSLRLPILSHMLTDLGNLSVFLFMNMVHL